MSKDRKPGYFDFIHQYDDKLNAIYRQWEEQIAIDAASKSKSLFAKTLLNNKSWIAGIAIALGSVAAVFHHGSTKMTMNLIDSNSHKINAFSQELNYLAAIQPSAFCVSDNHVYELTSETANHIALLNQPRGFISQPNTLSLIRHSKATQKPDAYLHLNPYHSMLFTSIEETKGSLSSESVAIDLGHSVDTNQEPVGDLRQVIETQSDALNLNAEFMACWQNHRDIDLFRHHQYSD